VHAFVICNVVKNVYIKVFVSFVMSDGKRHVSGILVHNMPIRSIKTPPLIYFAILM